MSLILKLFFDKCSVVNINQPKFCWINDFYKIRKPHICVSQAFKVGNSKIKNSLEIKCVNRKSPNFEWSDISLLTASRKNFIISIRISIKARIDHLHICVDQAFKVERGEKILLDRNVIVKSPDRYCRLRLYFLISILILECEKIYFDIWNYCKAWNSGFSQPTHMWGLGVKGLKVFQTRFSRHALSTVVNCGI